MIEIITSAALNTVQDFGRPDAMASGVSNGGAMDRLALAVGNLLLGNEPDAAGVEVTFFPFRLRFSRDMNFALTGAECIACLDDLSLPSNWAITAKAGQVLTVTRLEKGCRAYFCVGGGITTPTVLGSRSTDLKAGFGGFQGRSLLRGDEIPCGDNMITLPEGGYGLAHPPALPDADAVMVHVLPAAEHEEFTLESRERFMTQPWRVTPSANRTGYRLEGQPLKRAENRELFSHGIVAGTVQVPPSGQPIVQLTDANTMGGYPKIATVIEPDLRLLAQAPVGASIFFRVIDIDDAVKRNRDAARHLTERATELSALRSTLLPWRHGR